VKERADASGDSEHAEQEPEGGERNAVAVGEEEVQEREKAAGSEPEEQLDDEEATHEIVPLRWCEGLMCDGYGANREDRDDRSSRDDPAAGHEGSQHERVIGTGAEERRDRHRERAGDRARKERRRGAERDLLTEARGAPCGLGRVGEERGPRRARDDPAETDKQGG
jgi:hypothetical protein